MIWDTLSPLYDTFETIYNGKCFRGIAEEIKRHITQDDVVLECACGTGVLTLPMAQICQKLTATDYSEGMMKQARKKLEGYSNTTFMRADIHDLPFEDEHFDVVVAANVIHLVDNPDKALSEMLRVCKTGGRIIIPTYINETNKSAIIATKLLSMIGVKFNKSFDVDSYKEFFVYHGITVSEYSIVDGRMPCAFAIIEKSPSLMGLYLPKNQSQL